MYRASIALANVAGLVFFCRVCRAMRFGNVLFLTGVWHESVLDRRANDAPGPAMAATFAFPGGVLGHRYGQRYVGFAGAMLACAGGLWWRTHMGLAHNYAGDMLPSQILTGTGTGLVLPTLSAAATGALPPARFATGTAMIGMSRQLGSALGVAILVAIIGTPDAGHALGVFRATPGRSSRPARSWPRSFCCRSEKVRVAGAELAQPPREQQRRRRARGARRVRRRRLRRGGLHKPAYRADACAANASCARAASTSGGISPDASVLRRRVNSTVPHTVGTHSAIAW